MGMSIAPRGMKTARSSAEGTITASPVKYSTVNRLSGHTVNPVASLEVRVCVLPAAARSNAAIIKIAKD